MEKLPLQTPSSLDESAPLADGAGSMAETWAIVDRWLHPSGRRQSVHTRRAYRRHAVDFIERVAKPLGDVRLDDLQGWWDQQQQRGSPASHRQAVAAVKSLLTFAQRSGAIRYNVGVAIEIKRAPDELAKRI